jgi:cytochrome oxidase Cu insertion factor (SCO1/SenC/PrrC family)
MRFKSYAVSASLLVLLALAALLAGCHPKGDSKTAGAGGAPATKVVWGDASDFNFTTADGKSVKLSSYGGRPLVVNFWAVW